MGSYYDCDSVNANAENCFYATGQRVQVTFHHSLSVIVLSTVPAVCDVTSLLRVLPRAHALRWVTKARPFQPYENNFLKALP
jgi:hypothetical protein